MSIPGAEPWPTEAAQAVIDGVDGDRIHDRILELAKLNGRPLEPTDGHPALHYATDRVALSTEDILARQVVVEPWMKQAGMEVEQHPLAVVGRLPGASREDPLVLLSHVDTVPGGDMYDGTYGVISAIEVAEAMQRSGFEPHSDIIVLALTGEESTAFDFALFGSRALFHGLTERELQARNEDRGDQTLGQVLGPITAKQVQEPIFGPGRKYPMPGAALELHVEQGSNLEEHDVEIGLVELIAAPERYKAVIGSQTLQPDTTDYAYEAIFALRASGRPGHSGTTPMAPSSRADSLLATAELLEGLIDEGSFNESFFAIGDIEIDGGGSINKIPGAATTMLRIVSDDPEDYGFRCLQLQAAIDENNARYEFIRSGFEAPPFSIEQVRPGRLDKPRFFTAEILKRQLAAFDLIGQVNSTARLLAKQGVVGTVGTYMTTSEGLIELGVDIRGTDLEKRDEAVRRIHNSAAHSFADIELGEPLSGSGKPVVIDRGLLAVAETSLQAVGISHEAMDCLAGHDIQNVVRAGIPGLLMLIQSNNQGKAHNPDAYTAEEHLLAGARALAAVVTRLTASL